MDPAGLAPMMLDAPGAYEPDQMMLGAGADAAHHPALFPQLQHPQELQQHAYHHHQQQQQPQQLYAPPQQAYPYAPLAAPAGHWAPALQGASCLAPHPEGGDSSQRSTGSVGCGGREAAASPDSPGGPGGVGAAQLAARQQHAALHAQLAQRQAALQAAVAAQEAQLAAAQRAAEEHARARAAVHAAGRGHAAQAALQAAQAEQMRALAEAQRAELDALQGSMLRGGMPSDAESMRAHIEHQMVVRQQLLARTERLAAEVRRREAAAAAAGLGGLGGAGWAGGGGGGERLLAAHGGGPLALLQQQASGHAQLAHGHGQGYDFQPYARPHDHVAPHAAPTAAAAPPAPPVPLDQEARSSALAAARELQALLAGLPPDQRRAYAAELIRHRARLVAAGAGGAGAADVAAAALEHCQRMMAAGAPPAASRQGGAGAGACAAHAAAGVGDHDDDDEGEALLLPAGAGAHHSVHASVALRLGVAGLAMDDASTAAAPAARAAAAAASAAAGAAAAAGEGGGSSAGAASAAAGGADGGDTAASEVRDVVRALVRGTVAALEGEAAAAAAFLGDDFASALAPGGARRAAPEDRCSPSVRPGAAAPAAAPRGSASTSCGSPLPGGRCLAGAGVALPAMEDDAVGALLLGDDLLGGAGMDAGLLDDFLADFVGEGDACAPHAPGDAAGDVVHGAPAASAAAAWAGALAAAAAHQPGGSHASCSSQFAQPAAAASSPCAWAAAAAARDAGPRPPSFSAWAEQQQQLNASAHAAQPARLAAPGAGHLAAPGVHPAHLAAAAAAHAAHPLPGHHGGLPAHRVHAGAHWAPQCSAHATLSSVQAQHGQQGGAPLAPEQQQLLLMQPAATPFARAENHPTEAAAAPAAPGGPEPMAEDPGCARSAPACLPSAARPPQQGGARAGAAAGGGHSQPLPAPGEGGAGSGGEGGGLTRSASGSLTLRKRGSGSVAADAPARLQPSKSQRLLLADDGADSGAALAPPPPHQQLRPARGSVGGAATDGARAARPGFGDLVAAGYLAPGLYEFGVGTAQCVAAEVTPRGTIVCGGEEHGSISSFALAAARSRNPARQACDGWKEVRLGGRKLEAWRDAYMRGEAPPDAPLAAAGAAAEAGARAAE